MEKRWTYFFFFLWLCIVLTAQVLLFTNGFLLTRVAQFQNTTCHFVKELSCESTDKSECKQHTPNLDELLSYNVKEGNTVCLKPRSKVIWMILDAFRYDFALHNDSIIEPLPYQNNLPVILKLLNSQPNNTRLYKFIADPPTTTMQRLKGLTTGSLPTFIDAGSNFASHEINEDNIIDQMRRNGKNVIFMGDDTWNGLYPNRFHRNYPFPSFNVWDLDTVDNGVKANLFPEMKNDDWELLIAHFLGVDHCGHRYGPDHPEMKRKLNEMNEVITKIVTEMDEDTTLLVIGDHGMTTTGDHGGESENEVTAAMFVYSKRELTPKYFDNNNTVKQVDIVPTLSTILGIPIPHSNLGSIIYDILPITNYPGPTWQHDILSAWSNAQQLTTYIQLYSKNSDIFDPAQLESVYSQFGKLKQSLENEDDYIFFLEEVDAYVKSIRAMCEKEWIQFDAYSMARGLLLISHITIFSFLLVDGLSNEELEAIFTGKFIAFCYSMILISIVCSFALFYLSIVRDALNTAYFIAGLCSVCLLATLCVQNFQTISATLYESGKNRKWPAIIARIIIIFSGVMLLSNSFILEEAKVMLFFLLTLVLVTIVDLYLTRIAKGKEFSLKSAAKSKVVIFGLLIFALIRVTTYFWKCREEHGCNDFAFSKSGSSQRIEWILTIISLSVFVTATRSWLKACGNLNGSSMTVLLARYAPSIIIVCIGGFWVLHNLPKDTKLKLIGPWQPDMLAWVAYALILLGVFSMILEPLCVFRIKNTIEVDTRTPNVIPQLAKQVFINKGPSEIKIYGLATVFTSGILIFAINIILLWTLLLGDIVVPSVIAILFASSLILAISTISRYENATKIEHLLETPHVTLVTWFILSIYLFYASGHQPTFPNIAWEAAFVGTGGNFVYNFIPAALVLINTFGSFIITGLALPLIIILPLSLDIIFPYLSGRRIKLNLSRGDMAFYDHDNIAFGNLFKLCSKYIMCHVFRVFCSMLAATIHCRHLMVWNIFAPKLIFESISLITTAGSVLVGYLLVVHLMNRVDRLVKGITKQSS